VGNSKISYQSGIGPDSSIMQHGSSYYADSDSLIHNKVVFAVNKHHGK
jgi:hypothetical protein